MKPSLSTKDYHLLELILEAIDKIEEYTSVYKSVEQFNSDNRGFDATMMNFIIIGEMVGKLSDAFVKNYPDVEWQKIKGFRNIVAHNYFGIDAEEVWQIVNHKIPLLKSEIKKIIAGVRK
jgi:uncharacterized protein with HEPN domain